LDSRFLDFSSKTNFFLLSSDEQKFLRDIFDSFRLSFQDFKQLVDISRDLDMWQEGSLRSHWLDINGREDSSGDKKKCLANIHKRYEEIKRDKSYKNFDVSRYKNDEKSKIIKVDKPKISLGDCPVASPKTRCCNLLTLDVFESCGFDCSYCSIQSFYNQNQIGIDPNFATKLKGLTLDPSKRYHIGTGQSSDSLMWGNKHGVLDALCDFARANSNVILEFKTKSNNIKYFLEHEAPKNIVCTWSLNTPTIIENEEHLSSTLQQRLDAARALANRGIKVGFHFHPMVEYEGYLSEYADVFATLINMFSPEEVMMVSLGTLTFIKPVIKKLRSRGLSSKILQMPFENASGKFSYPLETKKSMFSNAYNTFKPWHEKVFFYMCMEDHSLWKDVFGYEYSSNDEFEEAMLDHYFLAIG
jgi:spore photoproduct lyase